MNCTRCNAEAVIKRGNTAYCAKCALARDWEEIIMVVQEGRVDPAPTVSFDDDGNETSPKKAGVSKAEQKAAPEEKAAPKEKAKVAADPESNGSSDDFPADPFA
ncbi:MAG: hypothetical protein OEM94_11425 [Acidimicrobiia bacterium]|nr:hypothetical protein [Acidimicrobiia bacterium]